MKHTVWVCMFKIQKLTQIHITAIHKNVDLAKTFYVTSIHLFFLSQKMIW